MKKNQRKTNQNTEAYDNTEVYLERLYRQMYPIKQTKKKGKRHESLKVPADKTPYEEPGTISVRRNDQNFDSSRN